MKARFYEFESVCIQEYKNLGNQEFNITKIQESMNLRILRSEYRRFREFKHREHKKNENL